MPRPSSGLYTKAMLLRVETNKLNE